MPITNPRGRKNVEMIRITEKVDINCSCLERKWKKWRILSKCCLFTGKLDRNCVFCHFGDISFIQRRNNMLSSTFCHLYSCPSPFGLLMITKTIFRTIHLVKTEVKCVKKHPKIWKNDCKTEELKNIFRKSYCYDSCGYLTHILLRFFHEKMTIIGSKLRILEQFFSITQ